MEFGLSLEEQKFQREVREFITSHITQGVIEETMSGLTGGENLWRFYRQLGAKGWLSPTLPKEEGGIGGTYMQKFIIEDEMHYQLPEMVKNMAGGVVAPTLKIMASEQLQKKYLPRIARGELYFALGYTEANAGSDLAALEMRAEEKDDCFIVNGEKLYGAGCVAQCDWLAVRTDPAAPKHKGISVLIADLDTPGITVTPWWVVGGERMGARYYENVRIPKENLIGKKNDGWKVIRTALTFERLFTIGHVRRIFDDIVSYVKETKRNGEPLSRDPVIRQKLAQMAIELQLTYLMNYQTHCMFQKGVVPFNEAAALKVLYSELGQKLGTVGLSILGLYGQLMEDSKWAPLKGRIEHWRRMEFRRVVGGGANDIQRNLIAQLGLGMPRQD